MYKCFKGILKFGSVFLVMTMLCAFVWEKYVDGKIYDCSDPLYGYLTPDGWVGNNHWPVVVVEQIVPSSSMGDPDTIKEGWSVTRLWCLWSSFFAVSLIVSFLLAKVSWSSSLKKLKFVSSFPR